MAVINFGAIVTDGRGKSGGNQLSKTRAGNILQKKCQQRKGSTPAQSSFRTYFSFLARRWRTLTQDQRDNNNAASVNYPYMDKFGNVRYYNGYQLLMRSNLNQIISNIDLAVEVPFSPPAAPEVSGFTASLLRQESGEVDGQWSWTYASEETEKWLAQVYFTRPFSPGSTYNGIAGLYVTAGNAELGVVDAAGITFRELNKLRIGDLVGMKVVFIDILSGVEVSRFHTSVYVEASV